MTEDAPPPAFAVAVLSDTDSPAAIAARLIEQYEGFADLLAGKADILVLMRGFEKSKGGKAILGTMELPRFQGSLSALATWLMEDKFSRVPDFIMTLDHEFWETATPLQRTALVHHELKHARHARDREGELKFNHEGDPVWEIAPHDIEEFNEVVRIYGAWLDDVASFATALRDGGAV